jgi:hypothetical protein
MNETDPGSGQGASGFEQPANPPYPLLPGPEQPVSPVPPQGPSGKPGFFARRRNIVISAAIAVVAVAGITIGLTATSGSSGSTTTASSSSTSTAGPRGQFGGGTGAQGANARTTNEPGGTSGTVSSVSGSTFTVTTTIGEKMTINESSSTTYENATSGTSTATTASAVTTGAAVLVLGTVNSTTIAATQVTLEPADSGYTTASSDVTALQQGQQNTSQSYGTIPSYTEGQGTIVGATTADEAVTTALKQYPGGVVDRVVQLANGDYEVHDIGTNIHHIFENSSFQVIGAN